MIKDLKNVIITFGLIALVFTLGSSVYQKKIKQENSILAANQTATNDSKLIQAEKDNLFSILKQQEDLKKQQELNSQFATQNTSTENTSDQTEADLVKQQSLLLAEQKAKAKILATEKAKAQAEQKALALVKQAQAKAQAALSQAQVQQTQNVVVSPSRQSRAS